ncbi:hypothetical protein [Actinoplanes sp. NPDC051494]|uniref:hypothetical protein n=1 Tax=Actinoplanes sp. NPDC051494 TaxID=3363907 RepID=UPI00378ED198
MRTATGITATDVVREHARRVLEAPFRADQARRDRADDLARRGYRIVTGGRTSASTWEVRDWRTGDLIVAGTRADVARLDPGGTWYHADNLYADVPVPDVSTPGLPPSLARVVEDWLAHPATPDEEIAEFVGWTVARVREHR